MAEKDYLATRMFKDRTSAEREYAALAARGYSSKDVNVLMTEEGRKRHFGEGAPATELGNKALEGAGVGGGIGAVAGGTLAAIAAAATLAIPGWASSWQDPSRQRWQVRARARSPEGPSAGSSAQGSRKSG